MAFDPIELPVPNVGERVVSRTLLQFRNAAVFQAVLSAFAVELQTLLTAISHVIRLRCPDAATGEQLNALGRIVGLIRPKFDYSTIDWFTPDEAANACDIAPAWVTGGYFDEATFADDGMYRHLIEFKVARNHVKYGSIPEIQAAIKAAFGLDVSFFRMGPMEMRIMLPGVTPGYIKNFLTMVASNQEVENLYYPPYPMTWRITGTYASEDIILTDDMGNYLLDDTTGLPITIDNYPNGG